MDPADQERWLAKVGYSGNPNHKRNPGDFGLHPPASPRPDKALCDDAGIDCRAEALERLREGVRAGLVSEGRHNGWPKNIWSFDKDGRPLEAQLENAEAGTYHGYPLPEHDPFHEKIMNFSEVIMKRRQ